MITHNHTPVVLFIDTDGSLTYLIERYGRASGCQVVSVRELEEAIAVIRHTRLDLVMLHVEGSSFHIRDILRTLKADYRIAAIPVICVESFDSAQGGEEGADYYLSKLIMYEDFQAALEATGII